MRLLFDQNFSFRILPLLPDAFQDSVTVNSQGLTDKTDREIWEFARAHGYTIVTQDSDFHDLTVLYGHPPKVIWIRTGNLSTAQIADIISRQQNSLQEFYSNNELACFEVFALRR